MSSACKVITQPALEPISLIDAKSYLRVDFPDDDPVIARLIIRARAYAETITHRAFATQQIQQIDTIERPVGGELSGSIGGQPNWYNYNEQLGANPFGAAQFYFDLAFPPVQASQAIMVQTKVTAFSTWTAWTGTTWLDDTQEPARLYFQVPITANFWMFQYWAGYDPTLSIPVPPDALQSMYELVGLWYQYREGGSDPLQLERITCKLLSHRVDWM